MDGILIAKKTIDSGLALEKLNQIYEIQRISNEQEQNELKLYGDLPSPMNPPKACKFHTRCPYVMDICSQKV